MSGSFLDGEGRWVPFSSVWGLSAKTFDEVTMAVYIRLEGARFGVAGYCHRCRRNELVAVLPRSNEVSDASLVRTPGCKRWAVRG
jgi:hypothetical protein